MMLFPKPVKKKKTKKHSKSIMHYRDGTCYLCEQEGNYKIYPVVHEHHIFGGSNRQLAEEDGLKVYLCIEHHTVGRKAVHNNQKMLRRLQAAGQREYERTHSRQQFMDRYGRNYLEEEK